VSDDFPSESIEGKFQEAAMNRTMKVVATIFVLSSASLAVSACAALGPPAPGYAYGEPGYGSVDLFYGDRWDGGWHHDWEHHGWDHHGWHDHGGHGGDHAAGHTRSSGFAHGGFAHGGGGHGRS
jgi:uncharacterized membrane protein YgcG